MHDLTLERRFAVYLLPSGPQCRPVDFVGGTPCRYLGHHHSTHGTTHFGQLLNHVPSDEVDKLDPSSCALDVVSEDRFGVKITLEQLFHAVPMNSWEWLTVGHKTSARRHLGILPTHAAGRQHEQLRHAYIMT